MIPVQIVIGRNTVDGDPLSADAWGRFRARIIHHLAVIGNFYAIHPGHGIDMKGGTEENVTILGSYPEEDRAALAQVLQQLRVEFEQAVILLIWGELEVIS